MYLQVLKVVFGVVLRKVGPFAPSSSVGRLSASGTRSDRTELTLPEGR